MQKWMGDFVIKHIAALILALAAIAVVLSGGVGPGFYLDDWSSLAGLEGYRQHGGLLQYITNGVTGFPGRPLAYLTFAMQAESWPSDAAAFKVVNLVIHLLNATLVFLLFFLLQRKQELSLNKSYLPLLIALVWAILPIQVGAVFYVVQRMTLMSAFFVLLALVTYVWARLSYRRDSIKFLFIISMALLVGYLGILAKENAILLGGFILAIEYTVFSQTKRHSLHKLLLLTGCLLPVILVFAYGGLKGMFTAAYHSRDFTLVERLLSQGNALIDYLALIVFPNNAALSLFNDNYQYPSSISEILISLVSWSAIFGASFIAVRVRKHLPLLAMGWLFFVVGHLLESTVFPLELYFEHRNYLPSVGIVVLIFSVIYQFGLSSRIGKLSSLGFTFSWVFWLVLVSWEEASVWGNPQKFAMSALAERPDSLRARQEVSAHYYYAGSVQGATKLLYSIESDFGPYAGTYAQLIRLKCEDDNVVLPSHKSLRDRFLTAEFDRGVSVAFRDIWERKKDGYCDSVSWDLVNQSIEWLSQNPEFQRENIFFLRGITLMTAGKNEAAYQEMLRFPESRRSGEYQLLLVRLALVLERLEEARQLLGDYEANYKKDLRQWYGNKEIYEDVKEELSSRVK